MGARCKRSGACSIASHGVSAEAFQITQLEQHNLSPAVDASTMVRYGSTTIGNTCHCRTMGSDRVIICSEFRKGKGPTRPESIKSWGQGAFWRRNGDKSRLKVRVLVAERAEQAACHQRSGTDKDRFVSCTHGHQTVSGGTYAGRGCRTSTCDALQVESKEENRILDSTQERCKIAIVQRLEAASQRVES